MRLKTLEMIGFKSFSDKTVVTFQSGVTAVVGPNGCGKSNISDAIRWVLGEQSAKHLRGDKMEDVIFNGSESRKPLGMAEVTLKLTNVGGMVSSEFAHYSEIEITRRLYRSGESEYLINKIPCRLKDIRDLMMDAGVGAKLHAIIEQDRVKKIVESKPEERRFLFEETAGVMKYKARRQEALSKLESTQQNQLRVNDIITEVKRQVNSLDRQAKKAERYQKLRGEMQGLDFRLASVEYSELGTEWTARSEEFTKAENEITELHASLGKAEASIEELRMDALTAENELSTLQHRIHETETALSRSEHRIEMSRGQIAALHEQQGRDLADMEYLKQEAVRTAEQKAAYEKDCSALTMLLEEKNVILAGRNAALDELTNVLREKEQAIDETRTSMFNALHATAAEKAKITQLQAGIAQNTEQNERALQERQGLALRLQELTTLIADREREMAELSDRRNAALDERARIAEQLEQATAKKKTLETDLGFAKNQLAAQGSRLRSLLELEQRHEGYQKGVQTVMSAHKEASGGEHIGTILGLVADMIETEPKYELAIESVLGERLQYVVVDSQNDSLKAIDYLKSRSGGRSTFVPKNPREIHSEPFVKNGHAGVIGSALTVVNAKENYTHVAEYLLGDVVIVDTMETALYLWQKNGTNKTIVTLAGEVLDPWGAVTGGTVDASGAGMLAKRREIKDLETEVVELESRASELETELHSVNASINTDSTLDAELSQAAHRMEIELVNRKKDCDSVREDIGRVSERTRVLDEETAKRTAQNLELNSGMEQAAEMLRSLEAGHSNAQSSIEALQSELSRQRDGIESARAEVTEIRMELASLQEKHTSAQGNLTILLRTEKDLGERFAKREAEVASITEKLVELEAAIEGAETEIQAHIKKLEEERSVLLTRQEAHSATTQTLHAAEEEARQVRHDIDTVQKRLSANEIRRTELRMKIEHLKDRIWTTYHAELEAVVRDLGQFEINTDAAKLELDELRQKIDQMGPINVEALQEYTELKERYDLLSAQQNDINESISNLKATIAKLDVETKELFMEAFTAIQSKFREVFATLFEGGKAEIVLLDEANVLESGIEIIAQPRGKRLQSILSLSGGEKSLTAIALLFAAFLVKPSPFCLLDEADAPLDEANVRRFTRLIREMSSHSQFIVITHQKPTMEMADSLYGITMEEPGSSKVVSVQLREAALV